MTSGTGPPGSEKGPPPRATKEATYKVGLDNDDSSIVDQPPSRKKIQRWREEYRAICVAQRPIEAAFWRLERHKAQLADQLANAGVKPFCKPLKSRI